VETTLTLTYEQRSRSRQRAQLADGRLAGLQLPHGTLLHHGDRLLSDDGLMIAITAASEDLSTVRCADALLLARACYHLGNRHVPLQIGPGQLSYLSDPVLDELLRGLGLTVRHERIPFHPEPGAYRQAGAHP